MRGRLYLPTTSERPPPVVVMAHGTSGTVPMVLDRYAEVFQAAGLAALAYDHRNFGGSDGEPRHEINPWVQTRGMRDAVTFAQQLKDVDPDRVGLWGDSGAGGEAIVATAFDDRVRVLVVQCPVCGSRPPAPDPDGERARRIGETLRRGDVTGTPEATIGPMPVVSSDQVRHPSLLKPISAFRWFIEFGGRHGSGWANDVTRVLPPTPGPFDPVTCAPLVRVPTLMMVAPEDEMVHANPDVARAAFERLAGPKQWHDIAGGHFGLLWHPSGLFDQASRVQAEFFANHLR
ncbi:MAG TPA: alpha/beta fold hydrolase [Thermoplasmata archaeon]